MKDGVRRQKVADSRVSIKISIHEDRRIVKTRKVRQGNNKGTVLKPKVSVFVREGMTGVIF